MIFFLLKCFVLVRPLRSYLRIDDIGSDIRFKRRLYLANDDTMFDLTKFMSCLKQHYFEKYHSHIQLYV